MKQIIQLRRLQDELKADFWIVGMRKEQYSGSIILRTLIASTWKRKFHFYAIFNRTHFLHRKPKLLHSHCLYYLNSCAACQVLLQVGEIAVNARPTKEKTNNSSMPPK